HDLSISHYTFSLSTLTFLCLFFASFFVLFFFLMIRPPPRSTLFPTRRSSDLVEPHEQRLALDVGEAHVQVAGQAVHRVPGNLNRSEEHTSELQSRGHLVCRLLLEKKKKTNKYRRTPV